MLSRPRPKNPILVCGLPGSGYVGKFGADYIIKVFKAKKVAEYYSYGFPPHVNVSSEGVAKPMRAELFHGKTGQESDLLILTADSQPSASGGEYELSRAVLELASRYKVKIVYSLAAYITGSFSKEARVFGTSTSKSMLERLSEKGVKLMKDGGITGMNGIIVGMARLYGMEGVCLLGETSGYLLDAGASQAVLEALSRMLGISIDMTSIHEKVRETQQIIAQIQQMADQGALQGGQGAEESQQRPSEGRPGYIH